MTTDWIAIVETESAQAAAAFRAASPDLPVAGCPGWTVADLAAHVGHVQRWATRILLDGRPGDVEPAPTEAAAAGAWFEAGTPVLLDALRNTDPARPTWNFTREDETAAFWHRRQALEITLHHWDAQSAAGTQGTISAPVAAHLVDELLTVLARRIARRDKTDLTRLDGDLHVHCTDSAGTEAGAEWTLEVADGQLLCERGHRKAAAALRGPAATVALALYGRIPLDEVDVLGDLDLVRRWRATLTL